MYPDPAKTSTLNSALAAKMSVRVSMRRESPAACSGDMYIGVPQIDPLCVRRASSAARANPKSVIFTFRSGPDSNANGVLDSGEVTSTSFVPSIARTSASTPLDENRRAIRSASSPLAEFISREFLNRILPLPSDTGIDLTHPDLNVDVTRSRSFLGTTTTAADQNGHGTHVAGTIAALGGNDLGVVGVSPG